MKGLAPVRKMNAHQEKHERSLDTIERPNGRESTKKKLSGHKGYSSEAVDTQLRKQTHETVLDPVSQPKKRPNAATGKKEMRRKSTDDASYERRQDMMKTSANVSQHHKRNSLDSKRQKIETSHDLKDSHSRRTSKDAESQKKHRRPDSSKGKTVLDHDTDITSKSSIVTQKNVKEARKRSRDRWADPARDINHSVETDPRQLHVPRQSRQHESLNHQSPQVKQKQPGDQRENEKHNSSIQENQKHQTRPQDSQKQRKDRLHDQANNTSDALKSKQLEDTQTHFVPSQERKHLHVKHNINHGGKADVHDSMQVAIVSLDSGDEDSLKERTQSFRDKNQHNNKENHHKSREATHPKTNTVDLNGKLHDVTHKVYKETNESLPGPSHIANTNDNDTITKLTDAVVDHRTSDKQRGLPEGTQNNIVQQLCTTASRLLKDKGIEDNTGQNKNRFRSFKEKFKTFTSRKMHKRPSREAVYIVSDNDTKYMEDRDDLPETTKPNKCIQEARSNSQESIEDDKTHEKDIQQLSGYVADKSKLNDSNKSGKLTETFHEKEKKETVTKWPESTVK